MSIEYQDRWISCTSEGIEIRGYYVPWGTKRIPYGTIRSVKRVDLSPLRGRMRVWGTANPRYWAHLDPKRFAKRTGLVLDLGHPVRPLISPDDPDAVDDRIRAHAGDVIHTGGRAPII